MGSFQFILWAILAASLMFVFPQVFILLIVGLSPSVVAFLIDRTPKKYATFCVGGMNISGVFPAFQTLPPADNSIAGVTSTLTNPFEMTFIFAAAGLGWLIYFAFPPVLKSLLTILAQHRITILRGEQRQLIRDWGEGIAIGAGSIEDNHPAKPPESEHSNKPASKQHTGEEKEENDKHSKENTPDPKTPLSE